MTGADRVSVTPQGQPLTDYGVGSTHTSSDLIGPDVAIKWTGTTGEVTGKIKNISTPWADFDSKSDNTGHFFPIKLDDQYRGENITVIGKATKTVADLNWVLRVENAQGGEKGTFTFKKGGDLLFVLDFSKATLEGPGG